MTFGVTHAPSSNDECGSLLEQADTDDAHRSLIGPDGHGVADAGIGARSGAGTERHFVVGQWASSLQRHVANGRLHFPRTPRRAARRCRPRPMATARPHPSRRYPGSEPSPVAPGDPRRRWERPRDPTRCRHVRDRATRRRYRRPMWSLRQPRSHRRPRRSTPAARMHSAPVLAPAPCSCRPRVVSEVLREWPRSPAGCAATLRCRVNPRVVMIAIAVVPTTSTPAATASPATEPPRVDVDAEIGVELARQSDRETRRQTPHR